MQGYLNGVTEGTGVLPVVAVILFAGFIMTGLTNTLNLLEVRGYILVLAHGFFCGYFLSRLLNTEKNNF